MTIESRWNIPVPELSLHKWLFGSASGPLPTVPQLIDADHPETHYLTMTDYRQLAKRIALGLQKAGLKPGDRVLMYSGNNIYVPTVFMGILMAGGIFTGANPAYVARELAYQLKDSGAFCLFAAETSMDVALDAAAQVGLPRDRIYSFDATIEPKAARTRHWASLLASKDEAEHFEWVEPADPKTTTCCLNYSSGTTGVPKGVEITHHAYVANNENVNYIAKLNLDYETVKAKSRQLCFLPLYHAYGQTCKLRDAAPYAAGSLTLPTSELTYSIINCILPSVGTPIYIMPAFDFEKMLQHVAKFRITSLALVPPILVALAKSPLSHKYDLSSVEDIGCGAAPLGHEVCDELVKLWPPGAVKVRQGWGMTEVTCTGTGWDPNIKFRSIAVGELAPNFRARLMRTDGSGEVTKANEPGELWVTSPTMLKGYWQKPEATADTLHIDPDGTRWLKTGDIASVEFYGRGGLWHVVDRIKELIKVKANQVAPAELEAILLEHEGVIDCAVIGVTINGEEVPRAYVVPNPSAKATEQEIAKWMDTRVVHFKRLKGGVKYIDAIPKNPSGKILRKILRDQSKKEVGDRTPPASRLA